MLTYVKVFGSMLLLKGLRYPYSFILNNSSLSDIQKLLLINKRVYTFKKNGLSNKYSYIRKIDDDYWKTEMYA